MTEFDLSVLHTTAACCNEESSIVTARNMQGTVIVDARQIGNLRRSENMKNVIRKNQKRTNTPIGG